MPLGNDAVPCSGPIEYPSQLSSEDPDPVRTEDINHERNLGACPPKFAIAGPESIPFKLGWKHGYSYISC